MNRSRSGQCGSAASNFKCRVNSAVAASAIPIGIPGCPLLAASTASIARARMALARRRSVGCIRAPAMGFAPPESAGGSAAPLSGERSRVNACPESPTCVTGWAMDDVELSTALERAERALERIERALATLTPSHGRDEELGAKVREAVAELDQQMRYAAVWMAA